MNKNVGAVRLKLVEHEKIGERRRGGGRLYPAGMAVWPPSNIYQIPLWWDLYHITMHLY